MPTISPTSTSAIPSPRASGELTLITLAVDYSYVNELNEQTAALERALLLDRAAPTGTVPLFFHYRLLERLGTSYLAKKDLSSSRTTFAEITNSIEHMEDAAARRNLRRVYALAVLAKAQIAELDDDADTARVILKKALAEPQDSSAQFSKSTVLLQWARLERNAGEQPAKALDLYKEAIKTLHAEKDIHTEIWTRMQLIRFLAVEATMLPEAPQIAAENLKLARVAASSLVYSDAEWRLRFLEGILQENAGHKDLAIAAYLVAVESLAQIRAGLNGQEQRQSFMDDSSVQELYRRLIQLLSAAGQKDKAWEYLERDKARVFLESLSGRHFQSSTQPGNKSVSSGKPNAVSELAHVEKQIITSRVALLPENETVLRAAGKQPELIRARLKALQNDYVLLRQNAQLSSSRATQPLSLRPISLHDVTHALTEHTALVEYAILDGALSAFVVTRTGSQQLLWKANTNNLPSKLRRLRDQMSSPDSGADIHASLVETSELLLSPVIKSLPSRIDSLLIVPAQALYYIPFQALLLPNGKMAVDRYTISYLPSASTLQFLKPRSLAYNRSPFLGALGNVSTDGWATLPGTLTETGRIATLYPKAQLVTGPAFTHQAALNALRTNTLVHFATHGLFDEDAPLFSALLTAPFPGQPSRLSLYEVLNLNLKARLVILSACETDRGHDGGR